jgi:hypothetical protein
MGLNVGDMFVNLGIKGHEKTLGAIGEAHKGMKGLGAMSLEAKAAILAAFYAIGRLITTTGGVGTSLSNYTTLTGLSAKTLQQYQWAAQQVVGTNVNVQKSFEGLQTRVAQFFRGEGGIKGLPWVAQTVGMTLKEFYGAMNNPELLLQKLQQFAQSKLPAALKRDILSSFGLDDPMMTALMAPGGGAFRPSVLKRAPFYSEGEIASLHKADVAWSNMLKKIEMAFGRFNAVHGPQLAQDIGKIADQVIRLTENLTKLAEKAKVFKLIADSFKGWDLIVGSAADMAGGKFEDYRVGGSKYQTGPEFWEGVFNYFRNPKDIPGYQATKPSVTVNQNLNFQHPGTDAQKTGDSTKAATKEAIAQMPATVR